MTTHQDHHYSVTVETKDVAVLHCLRALAHYAQETGNKMIAWGGTKRPDWERHGKRVTFHFSDARYRSCFLTEAQRLLCHPLWTNVCESDQDPAVPQS